MADAMAKLDGLVNASVKGRCSSLDPRTEALVRIAALIALGAQAAAYTEAVGQACDAGVSAQDVVETLRAVSTTVGSARVVTASAALASALGYDIDLELERPPNS
jgi:alkylhydroperoxidase/carboxymuconolactone decarboxylase family protein YurZ